MNNLKYSDIEAIVEQIVREKVGQYRRIAYYDADDIAQEVRIKCFTTLRNYDKDRNGSNLKMFLAVCADNRLKDIRRNLIYKHNNPCFRCEHRFPTASTSGIHDCLLHADKTMCSRYAKHHDYVIAKLSLNSPVSIHDKMVYDDNATRLISRIDFVDYVFSLLPSGMIPLFTILRDNNFNLKALKLSEQDTVIEVMKDIVYPEEM